MQKVIDNVSFSLFEGQYLAVIGPNGSGKSTLVKAITKEIKRYHGSISIDRHVTCVTKIHKKTQVKTDHAHLMDN